ncbi:MAG: glycosyl hydrolase family 95 catalytic domain-containing protein [Mangrovibacterium sp.]
MRLPFLAFLLFAIQALTSCCDCNSKTTETDPAFLLQLDAPIEKWDEAIPLGNGLTGGLLWGEDNEIRLSLDRGDLWDNRAHPGFTKPGFNYETVCKMAQAGKAAELNKQYAMGNDYPTKLPGCRLVLTLPEDMHAESFLLDMKKGLGQVNFGEENLDCFFNAVQPHVLMKIPAESVELKLIANEAVKKLGNDPATIQYEENDSWLIQNALPDFQYVFYVKKKIIKGNTLLAIAVSTNKESENPFEEAKKRAEDALNTDYKKQFASHEAWWTDFWSKSAVQFPDSILRQQYNLNQYFYGAASRADAPPMPLQAVWTADAGNLPPWHGDYHHDLNTELTYWAHLTSNHFDQGLSFINFMWDLKPVHEEFAKNFFGTSGIVVPGVMALDGKPMGAWYQYTLSPTMGAWVAHSFYMHWRYTMDDKFLKERAYPYCTGIANALVDLMKADKTGKLKLPLSSSPEIHGSSQKAWLQPNSNFDQSLIRWIFGANAEMAHAIGLQEEENRWNKLLAQTDELAVDENGALQIAPGESLKSSHRHFSHLLAIHPLGILNTDGTDEEKRIIEASLKQIDDFGTKAWVGYSFSWIACMKARAGQADSALEYLHDYMICTSRNGFHQNGPQYGRELSCLRMRAFTLEGNFAAAQAIHEMLLQSWGGCISVFPATPKKWADASFTDWRAEGGFVVSAERKEGKTIRVEITATVDQPLRLKNPFGKLEAKSNRALEKNDKGELLCHLKAGETLTMSLN